jgi:sarcosine oxidase subunit beta
MNTGSVLLSPRATIGARSSNYDVVGVKYEEWGLDKIKKQIPVYDLHEFWPVKRPEDPSFFDDPTHVLEGAIFCPEGGYVNDPVLSAHNIMRAAETKGAEFMFKVEVVGIRSQNGKVKGITLKDGRQIDARIVVNVAGPHSFKINQMAEGSGRVAASRPSPCGTR